MRGSLASSSGLDLWYVGYPEQALQRLHAALALARELAHPVSLALPWSMQRRSIIPSGGPADPRQAEAELGLSHEHGFPSGWRRPRCCGAGPWSSKARGRQESSRCAGPAACRRRGRAARPYFGHAGRGIREGGTDRGRAAGRGGGVDQKQTEVEAARWSCIASRENSCWRALPEPIGG